MRRILLIVIPLILIAAGIWWFFLRLTPEKVLKAALINLSKAETVKNVRVSAWDVLKGPGGEGLVLGKRFTFSGSIDARDMSRIQAVGTAGYSETGRESDLQYSDVVLSNDRAAFKLTEAGEDITQWFAENAGTSTEDRWFDFDRNILLEKKLSPKWIAVGDGTDIRKTIRDIEMETWAVPKGGTIEDYNGRSVMSIKLDPQGGSIEQGLLSLAAAWFLRDPTTGEIDWSSRAARGVVEGDWNAVVDLKTKQLLLIQGSRLIFDEDGNEVGHSSIEVWMSGFNLPIVVETPESAVDMTPHIDDAGPGSFTPAGERTLPLTAPAEDVRDSESESAS